MRALVGQTAEARDGRTNAVVDRLGAACGVVFTALTAVTLAVLPPPPESNVRVGEIRDYLLGHVGALRVSTALMGIATMAVVGFFAPVHARLRRTGADVAAAAFLLGAAVVVAATLLGLVIQAALVHQIAPRADDSTLGTAYALWDRVYHTAGSSGMAVALLASATCLRTSYQDAARQLGTASRGPARFWRCAACGVPDRERHARAVRNMVLCGTW